tara:strand:+ start:970 stop:1170 length:201 start_codon:yes stop_codon:yes gene_type:complete
MSAIQQNSGSITAHQFLTEIGGNTDFPKYGFYQLTITQLYIRFKSVSENKDNKKSLSETDIQSLQG